MKTSLKALCIMTIGSFAPCFAQIVSDIGYESPAAALAALREDFDSVTPFARRRATGAPLLPAADPRR